MRLKTWHSTIFAPYFVVGAVHSGVSAVAFVMIILRYIYGWQDYIRHEHIDALGRLLMVVATAWFYFFVMEIVFGFYGREADEIAVRDLQVHPIPVQHMDDDLRGGNLLPPHGPVVEPGPPAGICG